MNMKLSKESKKGNISNLKISDVKMSIAGIGILSVCGIAVFMGIKSNVDSNKRAYNDSYSSYSSQLEDIFEVDIDKDNEELLNEYSEILKNIDIYKNDPSIINKAKAYEKLIEDKDKIEAVSLSILKNDLAAEYGEDSSSYTVGVDNTDGWYATNGKKVISLSFDRLDVASIIGELQGFSEKELQEENIAEKYINKCEKLINKSAKIVTKTAEKNEHKAK